MPKTASKTSSRNNSAESEPLRGFFNGLTTDHVSVSVVRRKPQFQLSREQVIRSLPADGETCASFFQRSGYIEPILKRLESDNVGRFHCEVHGVSTYVWRVA